MSYHSDLSWALGSIVYHIYVRSFFDANEDGIGDLEGVIRRLDYLTSLGINAVWLSPIYPSPQADFGYDVADYKSIDPVYGSLELFDKFVHECHVRGIRILMDFVPNHTSSEHAWFRESRSSTDNPKRDWYIWKKGRSLYDTPNNWMSVFGGSAWEYDEETREYYLHTFEKNQPDLNWRNPEVVSEMLSILRFWLDRGVDGFRVDVPYHIFKNAEFLDEPFNPNFIPGHMSEYESLLHIHTSWLPESYEMMKQFAGVLKEYNHKFMVTEAWGTQEHLVKLYETVDWKYFAPFNFSLMTLPWRAEYQKEYIDSYSQALGELYIPCYVLGNHDRSRVVQRIGKKQSRIAAMLELSLPGIPFIYYGEEIGMSDADIPKQMIKDPFEINSPGLGLGRDPQRTPMQWDSSVNAGFSSRESWLPVHQEYMDENVHKQEQNPTSFLNLYKLLIKLKKHHPSLREGAYTPLKHPAENVFAFIRESDEESILVLLNFDSQDKHISLPYFDVDILCSASLTQHEHVKKDLVDFTLGGDEGYLFLLQK